ncbi:MAG: ABC transporter permease, partial [Pirellula sp.]
IKVALANDSDSWIAKRASELLVEQPSLQIADQNRSVTRSKAEDWVRRGMVSAAIVFGPADSAATNALSESVKPSGDAQPSEKLPHIEVLSDSYDQVASQVMIALVQRAVMTAAAERSRDVAIKRQQQVTLASATVPVSMSPFANAAPAAEVAEPPSIQSVDILGSKKTNPVIAMYAAGIAVMFLLFSATTASGSLLEERENSTLDRLLCSRLTMDQLLLGKWAFLTIIGMLQMTLMFSWGALVFGIDLVRHWEGFIAMTLVTAGAAASFALFLASMCKTRTQLGWVSTIVILTMSALGGSMVPRYLMSESIQKVGLLTFNAWALEGFNKIFWRELHLRDIELELGVLTLCAFCFIVTARMFATRWERS